MGMARVCYQLGQINAFVERDFPAASRYYKESLQLSRQIGERRVMALAINNLGLLAETQGDWADARSLYEQTLSLSRELGDMDGVCMGMINISMTLLAQGIDHTSGKSLEELLAESLSIARELGNKSNIAETLFAMGRVARFQNNYAEARKLHTENLTSVKNNKGFIVWNLLRLGELARLENDYVTAHSTLLEALSLAKEVDYREPIAPLFEEFAALSVAQRHAKRSAALFGAAEALRAAIQVVLYPVERVEVDKNIATARAQLSEDEFNQAWAEGKAMTMEEAVKFALEESNE